MIKSQIQGSALEESNLDKDYLEKLKWHFEFKLQELINSNTSHVQVFNSLQSWYIYCHI
jgi:hypothetical protein